ncbi:MAG: DUF1003 domain-containing protein [Candidatus Komeilibacteria bacterium]|nr:DUF1003 domain-containing protein [Candidatus Komeilibacteria bacterium]
MTNQYSPLTASELKQLHSSMKNPNLEHRENLKRLERVAVWITNRIGTVPFAIFCIILVTVPLVWTDAIPVVQYISSGYLQLVFLPLIMVGQNLQERRAEARTEADFKLNTQSAREIETILLHLEKQDLMMTEILTRLDQQEKLHEK